MASKMKALQIWCQKQAKDYNNVSITNMTTSWRDGLAFCALIHHYRPDLIDYDSLSKENILKNNQLAFEVAERELGIAALLDAEDMVAMKVPDKLSIITYVSQYYNVLHKLTPVAGGTSNKPQKRSASPLRLEESSVKRSPKPEEPPKMFVEKVQKFSLCEICKKKVHLVERFIDEGKIYHRHCHRTKSLSGMYRRDGSALMHNYMDNLKSPTKKEPTPIQNNVKSNISASAGVKAKVTAMEVSQPKVEDRNYARDTKLPLNKETATNETRFVKPATNKNTPSAMEVAPAKTDFPIANKDSGGKPQEKSPVKQFKVTDMVSKFSEHTTKPNQQQWTPPSKRNSGTPSSASSNRNSTASSDSKTNLNPFGDEKPDKTSAPSSGKSSKRSSANIDTLNVVAAKEAGKTIVNVTATNKAPESSKGASGDVVARSLFPSGAQTSTQEESKAKTNIASHSETGSKSNIQATETSKGPKSTPSEAKDPLLSQSKQPTDLSSDIKELNKEPSKKVDSKLKNDEAAAEMLPSLLKSLTDIKNKRNEEKEKFLSPKDDISPSSKTAPLIAELPKLSERPVPSARKSPRPNVVLDPPKAQPRLSRASTNSNPGIRNDSVDYNDDLNPFAEPDSSSSSELSPEVKEALNPFEMSDDDDENDDIDGDKSDSEGNPFGDEEEAYVEPPSKEMPKENGHKTLNVVGPGESRLNPFTDEYEGKKSPNLNQKASGTPPRPPSRRKGKAPAPPKPTTEAPPKAPVASVVKTPVPVTPPVRNKRQAPNWKNNVEKQMDKLNEDNNTDKKYVAKTDKSVSPKHKESPARSNAQGPSPNAAKIPSSRPSRAAPGFGFPLVKRKVKSQMTEDEITSEMAVVDLQLKDLERKGVKLEEVLREDMESGNDTKPESDQLLSEWFDLVHQKNKLVRRETELVFLMQQQRLEQQHADVEFMIRKLLNKPDSEKTEAEKEQEGKLLEDLVKIVERRNTIINSIEEERVKEEEEDAAYDMMKKLQRDSPNDSDGTKKKKKNKVKKIFSKKNKKEKTFTTPETKKK